MISFMSFEIDEFLNPDNGIIPDKIICSNIV